MSIVGPVHNKRKREVPFTTRRRSDLTNARARELRQGENIAEALLWEELKARRLGGYKFTRQMPLGPYFADFACRSTRLVIELDGSQHANSAYDERRNEFMRAHGYSVLRFGSHELINQRRAVCDTILAAIEGRLAEDVSAADLRFVFADSLPRPRV